MSVIARLQRNIRRLMADRQGMTQKELGVRSKLGTSTVNGVLKRGTGATLDNLEAIAKGLDVDISALFVKLDSDLRRQTAQLQSAGQVPHAGLSQTTTDLLEALIKHDTQATAKAIAAILDAGRALEAPEPQPHRPRVHHGIGSRDESGHS